MVVTAWVNWLSSNQGDKGFRGRLLCAGSAAQTYFVAKVLNSSTFSPRERPVKPAEKKKTKPFSTNEILYGALCIVAATVAAAISVIYVFFVQFKDQRLSADPAHWGQLGDYVGGLVNPVVGLATVILVFLTLILQRYELQQSLTELKRSNANANTQSFEQSLFAWLANYHALVEVASAKDGRSGRQALQSLYETHFSSVAVVAESTMSEDTGSQDRSLAHFLIRQDLTRVVRAEDHTEEQSDELDNYLANAIDLYQHMFRSNVSSLDAVLRTLYRLILWIDRSPILSDVDKHHYVALIRAQLSWVELVFLFYNGMTPQGEKFVRLSNKYALFDNLDPVEDFIIEYAMVKRPNAVPYAPSAYSSSLARADQNASMSYEAGDKALI